MNDLELMALLDKIAIVIARKKGGIQKAGKWVAYLMHKMAAYARQYEPASKYNNDWTRDLQELLSDDEWHLYHPEL